MCIRDSDGAISVDIHGTAHTTLLELAKAGGLRTGNVTTAEIQDATPAVQAAHVTARSCYCLLYTSGWTWGCVIRAAKGAPALTLSSSSVSS